MQSSYTFTAGSAVFDEQNLVSAAGLVPVLELAEQTGLSRLDRRACGAAVDAGEVRGGQPGRQADLDHRPRWPAGRTASMMRTCCAPAAHPRVFNEVYAPVDVGDLLARVHLRARQPARRGGPRASGGAGRAHPAAAGHEQRVFLDIDSLLRPVYGHKPSRAPRSGTPRSPAARCCGWACPRRSPPSRRPVPRR